MAFFGLYFPYFTYPGVADDRLFARVAEIATAAEDAGFDVLFVMDHFHMVPNHGPPTDAMPEAYTLLGALAARTSRIELGALVTGVTYRTVARQVARFDQLGLAGLVPPPKIEKHRTLPAEVRQAILDAKREHPSLKVYELTTICWARCGHRPSSHTVKRILAESPPPPRTHRRFPPYHAIADPSQHR